MQQGIAYNLGGAVLRAVSVGGKLLLVLYVGRFLSLEDLGVYGLTTTTVLLAVHVIGFDFYTFCARELLAAPVSARSRLLRDQLVCHALGYALVAPALLLAFAAGFLPWWALGYFCWILLTTHLCQEIHRVLITLSRSVAAYAVSAVAHGLWPLPVVLLGVLYPELRTLRIVFLAWAISASVGVLLGVLWLQRLQAIPRSQQHIDWAWIRQGVAVSYKFFLASLLYRSIEFSNRYFLHYFWGDARVGTYTFYASIANTAHDLTFTAVAAPLFGPLIESYQAGDRSAFDRHVERLRRGVLRSSVLLVPGFVVGIHVLVAVLAKPVLQEQLFAYYVLLCAAVLVSFSLVPHYKLYVRRMDNAVLLAAALAAAVNVAANLSLVPSHGVSGAALAALLSAGVLGFSKSVSARVAR